MLSVIPPALGLITYCTIPRGQQKLKDAFESKGPTRKATLLMQLIVNKMSGCDDLKASSRNLKT